MQHDLYPYLILPEVKLYSISALVLCSRQAVAYFHENPLYRHEVMGVIKVN